MIRNILIEDNVFESYAGPNLVITSAEGVMVRGNRLVSAMQDPPPNTGASYAEKSGSTAGKAIQLSKGMADTKGFE